MGIRSYFSQISTTISSSIREMSDASHSRQRAPRARREIAKAVSEALERRLLFVAGPDAGSFMATPATISTASMTPEAISITYTDMTTNVLASSIARTNITVTGPGSVGVLSGGTATAVPTTPAASVVGEYTVNPPAGGWTAADDGPYSVALNATVTDINGNPVTAAVIGSFNVTIPVPGPTAVLTTPTNITSPGGTTKSIVVTYTDTTSPIDVTNTIKPGNITVTGPGSTALTVLSATPSPATNGSPITVTYVVQAPGGTPWAIADDGTYTIGLTSVTGNIVKDVAGNALAANPNFGSFNVAISNPPTAAFTPPATILPGQVVFTFTVVYTDSPNLIAVSSIGINNVTVTGPTGQLQVLMATPTPDADANSISVVYEVSAPTNLGFVPADNGTYTVALNGTVPGAVTDTNTPPNAVVANPTFGTFLVGIVDTTVPTATVIQDFDITSVGQLSKEIIISYTDSIGIDPTTITTDNISVVSSTGEALVVTSAVPNPTFTAATITATYTIAKADGTAFTADDNGTYTVSINPPPLSPANVSGVHVPAVPSLGTFMVTVPDLLLPTGVVTAPDITTTGLSTQTITAVLTDNVAIRVFTIRASNLIVTDPNGNVIPVARVIGLNQANGPTITVQFIIDAPRGTWTNADNGVYSIALFGVTDTDGNFMMEADGSFDIDIPAPFVPNFSLGNFSSVKGQKNKLKFRDTPDGTMGIITIKNGTGEAIQEGTTNAIDLVLNDIGKGVDVTVNSSNGRPLTINNIFVHGTLVNFNAPNANITGTFYVNGTAEKATFRHLVGTSLVPAVFAASGPIQKLTVTNATTQALILSGANLGSTGLLNQPDDTFAAGEIDSVTLGGQLTTTVVAAGAAPGADGMFGTKDDTSAGSGSFINTVIAPVGTGQGNIFESNSLGKFKFNNKKFTPNPATDPRFVILP